jgi:hypothetical protein
MKKLIIAVSLLLILFLTSSARSQIIFHQYNVVWSGGGVTASGVVTFNSDFSNYNPSSAGNNEYIGPVSGLIDNLNITVAGNSNPAHNRTFTIADYDDVQWNTGGATLDFQNNNILSQLGVGADFALIAKNGSLAPSADWSDPLLTLRTVDGTMLTMQSFSAVPEPEEWMGATSLTLIAFGLFYSKMRKKS